MAVPVLQATQTSTTNTAGTSHTVTLPTGIVAGDTIVVCVVFNGTPLVTWPSGWTKVLEQTSTMTMSDYTLVRAAGGETSITLTTDTSVRMAARAWRISGARAVDAPTGGGTANTNTTPNPPALTPPATDDYLYIAVAGVAAAVTVSVYPTSYSNSNATSATSGPTIMSASRTVAGSGSGEDPSAFTISASNYWRAHTIAVRAQLTPVASFTSATVYGTRTVNFTDTSTNDPLSWAWTFGDTTTSTLQNPSHTYTADGTYTVGLTATRNGASNATTGTVTVALAAANFTYTQAAVGLAVAFTNTSGGTTTYSWAFGDGTTSTTASPTHTYPLPGRYTVTLTASNATSSSTKTVTITVLPVPTTPPARPDGLDVELALYANGSWFEYTCDVTTASWQWGASGNQGLLTQQEAGSLTFTAWDPDRQWDPRNAVSPYYGVLDIGTLVRVRIGTATVFTGRIATITHALDRAHGVDFVTVTADDQVAAFGRFAADVNAASTFVSEATHTRLGNLATLLGWPAGSRDIGTSSTTLQAVTVADQVWPAMQEAAIADGGRLQLTQAGVLHFRERTTAWATSAATLTIGCGGNVEMEGLSLESSTSALMNTLSVAITGGSATTLTDATSVARYGTYTATKTDLLLSTAGAASTWGSFVLARQASPMYGVSGAMFPLTSAIASTVTTALMGDRWRVRDEHHGPMIDTTQRLLGLAYSIGPTRVLMTATLGEDYGLTSSLVDQRTVWNVQGDWEIASAYGRLNLDGSGDTLHLTNEAV